MTKNIQQRRVMAILQVRLDGAEAWDVAQHVADKEAAGEDPWTVAGDAAPLTAEQVADMIKAADAIIAESYPDAPPELARHIAMRRNLYARAVQAGETATAARILRDIAELEGVSPAKGSAKAPAAIDDKKLTLLLAIQERHLAVLDAPRLSETLFEHGPLFSAARWFDCQGDDAARMRWQRTLNALADEGLVIISKGDMSKWANVKLSEEGQAIIRELPSSGGPAARILKVTA